MRRVIAQREASSQKREAVLRPRAIPARWRDAGYRIFAF
jgi:hypothetical protein